MLYLSDKFKEQQTMLTPDKIIEIFVKVDDFCKECDGMIKKHRLESNAYKIRNREASLSDSEIITILIAFHTGHFTNLKHFYLGHMSILQELFSPSSLL